jgi:HSP20 family protein
MPSRALDEAEHYMDEILAGWPFRTWRRLPAEEMSWSPPLEMYEKDDKFVVRAELPGVKQEDIDISMAGDTLIIKGEGGGISPVRGLLWQLLPVDSIADSRGCRQD